MTDTLLVLSSVGVPLYSARGLTQTLEPIDGASQARRTVNGALKDLSASQFRKYRSEISCTDQEPPAKEAFWPGRQITVSCVQELALYSPALNPDVLADIILERTAVAGSRRRSGDFVFYRPQLTMMLISLTMSIDEYPADIQWTMVLEES